MSVKVIGKHEKDSRACRDALALTLNEMMADALPLGNGRLGAMVYGIPATERLQLNEEITAM